MKTKLVYVLTCSETGTYIEQALMSIWSARHHNSDANIVLLTDDKTNKLLVGTRGELLNYITEKTVVPFEDENASMMFRSRWIKTSARELVEGDFLFIDCDTIICKSLADVDSFDCEIGAVGDNNVKFYNDISRDETCTKVATIGCDISGEEYYFSSGVIYCKDTEKTRNLYKLWHKCWIEGYYTFDVQIDQPSLSKANIECNHLIQPMNDTYNCVLYTQNPFLREATILHIPSYRNSCFLFNNAVFKKIRKDGLPDWVKEMILNIHATYLPFDYSIKHSTQQQRKQWIREIAKAAKVNRLYISRSFREWHFRTSSVHFVVFLFAIGFFRTGALVWLLSRRHVLRNKRDVKANICSIA